MSAHGPLLGLHIGKTAGTAFRAEYLSAQFDPDEILIDLNDSDQANARLASMSEDERSRLKFVFGHDLKSVIHQFPQPHRCMTIVRDPVEQVISQYFHQKYATLEKGRPLNRQIWEEGLDLVEAAERFGFFNQQTRLIVDLLDAEAPFAPESVANDLVPAFELIGITEKLQPFVYLLFKKYGLPLSPIVQRNSRSELVNQFIPMSVRNEIRARSHLDQALYDAAVDRFDAAFLSVLTSAPDLDPEWNAFRTSVQEVQARRYDENAEIVAKMEIINKEIDHVVQQVELANRTIAEKDREILTLRAQLNAAQRVR